mmetsp:Transcript_11235/g.32417  ORF Transcript_11235/g.32417 Transcript_11235/m.32417 type:complete len:90 (+) Transcript_11235:584-853(+)
MKIEGGLFGVANLYFGTHWKKRPSLRKLRGQAVYTYLQWAVVEYFTAFYGQPEEDWVVSAEELFASGPRQVRVERPRYEWTRPRRSGSS